jgi:hypothetical protein
MRNEYIKNQKECRNWHENCDNKSKIESFCCGKNGNEILDYEFKTKNPKNKNHTNKNVTKSGKREGRNKST